MESESKKFKFYRQEKKMLYKNFQLHQFGVYWVRLKDDYSNNVLNKNRPCVLLSNDINNNNGSKTVQIAPITSNMKRLDIPCHVKISNGVVHIENIMTVDKGSIIDEANITLTWRDVSNIKKSILTQFGFIQNVSVGSIRSHTRERMINMSIQQQKSKLLLKRIYGGITVNKKNYELEDLVSGGDEIYKSMNEKQREVVDALINKINRKHHELYGLRNTKNKYGEKIRKIQGYTYQMKEIEDGSYMEAYKMIETLMKARCGDCFAFGSGVYWALEKLRESALKLDYEEKEVKK